MSVQRKILLQCFEFKSSGGSVQFTVERSLLFITVVNFFFDESTGDLCGVFEVDLHVASLAVEMVRGFTVITLGAI